MLHTLLNYLAVAGGPSYGGIQNSGDGIEMLLDGLVRHGGSFKMIVKNCCVWMCKIETVNGDYDG